MYTPIIPTDAMTSLAGRILARRKATIEDSASTDEFNALLDEAKSLAGFVLNADPKEGSNR